MCKPVNIRSSSPFFTSDDMSMCVIRRSGVLSVRLKEQHSRIRAAGLDRSDRRTNWLPQQDQRQQQQQKQNNNRNKRALATSNRSTRPGRQNPPTSATATARVESGLWCILLRSWTGGRGLEAGQQNQRGRDVRHTAVARHSKAKCELRFKNEWHRERRLIGVVVKRTSKSWTA